MARRRRSGTNIIVEVDGAVLNGDYGPIMRKAVDAAKVEVARIGINELHNRMGRRFKHPTGRFESQVVTDRVAYNDIVIHDPVVYGPWLEGTSQRNQSTRFKGYKLFRLTRLSLKKKATQTAQKIIDRAVGRLNS